MSGLPSVTCPACQTEMGLEALLGADDARGVVEIMSSMPGSPQLRKAVLRYLGLFAPAKQKLRWDRAERLLAEVVGMMEAGRIERGGRAWPAPLDYWQQALDAIFAMRSLRRPLKGHGLLLEILSGLSDKAEAGQEAKAEAARQHQALARGQSKPVQVGRAAMPESVRKQLDKFTKGGSAHADQE